MFSLGALSKRGKWLYFLSDRELRWLPVAVEVTLELEDWGRLVRLIEVAG